MRTLDRNLKPYLEHVKGNTYCVVTGYARIPLYKLNKTDGILLDSGLPRDWEGILACLQENDLQIKAVLTSHVHPDHVGNHLNLRRQFGAKIYMTMYAASVCASPMNQVASYAGVITYRRLVKDMVSGFVPDHLIDWNARSITVEGATFGLLQLPGHNAEHLGIVTPDNVAYLGDTILSEHVVKSLRAPFCVCVELDLASKESLAETNYDYYIMAHNGVCTDIRELAYLNRDMLLEKADLLESLADSYLTLDALTAKMMKATGSNAESLRRVVGFRRNVTPFVDYLLDMGRLTCRVNEGTIEYIRSDLQ